MPDIYSTLQGVAAGLLKPAAQGGFGQGTIRHIALSPGMGPANRPGKPTETPTTFPGGTATGVPKSYITAGLALQGDLLVTAPVVAGLVVAMADQIEVDGVRYRVVQIEPVPPAGTPVVFKYVVRK